MFIYFCERCKRFEAFESKTGDFKCPGCSSKYLPLGVIVDEWNGFSNDEMLKTIEDARKMAINTPIIKAPSFTDVSSTDKYEDDIEYIDDEEELPRKGEKTIKRRIIICIIVSAAVFAAVGAGLHVLINYQDKKALDSVKEELNDKYTKNTELSDQKSIEEETVKAEKKDEEKKPEKRSNVTFRNTCWGDSIETVMENEEGAPVDRDNEGLAYEGTLDGHPVYILYTFQNGRLVEGGYALTEHYTNGGQYIALYEQWENTLSKQYGNPDPETSGIAKYVDDSLIDAAGPARALEYGYVTYVDDWYTSSTHIRMGLISSNYEITLMISYYDKVNYKSDDTDGF